jgi:hypothetical protein
MPVGKDSVTVMPFTAELLMLRTVTRAVSVRPQMVMFLGAEPTIFTLFPWAFKPRKKHINTSQKAHFIR